MLDEERDQKLNAYIDGELDESERRRVETWLEESTEAKERLADLMKQDLQLRAMLTPSGPEATLSPFSMSDDSEGVSFQRLTFLVVGAAAGFLLGVMLSGGRLGPGTEKQAPESSSETSSAELLPNDPATGAAGRVIASVGRFWLNDGSGDYRVPGKGEVYLYGGDRLKTDSASKLSLLMEDGSTIRCDEKSEVTLVSLKRLKLDRGKISANVEVSGEPWSIEAGSHSIDTLDSSLSVEHQMGSDDTPSRTSLYVLKGEATWGDYSIAERFECRAEGGLVSPPVSVQDLILTTSWVNELLAYESEDREELSARVDEILAMLGATKLEFLYEWEIRALGQHAVLPLARYLRKSVDGNARTRQKAGRLLADLSGPSDIPELIELAIDSSPELRRSISQGLKRITGTDLGLSDEFWEKEPIEAQKKWRDWWERRDRLSW